VQPLLQQRLGEDFAVRLLALLLLLACFFLGFTFLYMGLENLGLEVGGTDRVLVQPPAIAEVR
jgi:hypothetical protein